MRKSGLTSLLQRCLPVALVLTAPLHAQGPPPLSPIVTLDLHTHAEWRVDADIEFDPTGRLLILYRDHYKLKANGNWHLIRLTDPLSARPVRDEIIFSIPREPADPRQSDHWDDFHTSLLLSPDGNHAYATFEGAVVTAKPGPPPMTGGRNVNRVPFSSAVSFDLTGFLLLASADLTHRPTNPYARQIDAEGNLLLLFPTDTEWNISVLDKSLQLVKTATIGMEPIKKASPLDCQFRPDFKMECPGFGEGDLLLGPESVVRLPQSTCKMTLRLDPLGFGKDETLNDGRLIQSDHICVRNELGIEERVSPDLLPRCHEGWRASAVSPDRHSLLTSCYEEDSFLDTFFWVSKGSLQLIDVPTLTTRVTIPLSTRHRLAYAVFHESGTTTIAVLEDGVRLLLYTHTD